MKFEFTGSGLTALCDESMEKFKTWNLWEVVELVVPEEDKQDYAGTQSMINTWFMWVSEIAVVMAAKGITVPVVAFNKSGKVLFESDTRPIAKADCHEIFTHKYLGSDEHGVRYSWSLSKKLGAAPQAPRGKRLYAMEKLDEWATQSGIRLTIPVKSEYRKLQEETES